MIQARLLWSVTVLYGHSSFYLFDFFLAGIVKPFLSGILNQSTMSVETCFIEPEVVDGGGCVQSDCDIVVTTGQSFLQILKTGISDFKFFDLIVFDESHLAIDKGHPFAIILNHIHKCGLDPGLKIVGLTSEILLHQACPRGMESFLNTLEKLFNCEALISSDLLAMNRYGEQVHEEISFYTCNHIQDQLNCKISEILQSAVLFLKDYRVCEETQACVTFVKHILTECHKVLSLLGEWCTASIARIVIKEINKLEKKCSEDNNLLMLQFCRTQMDLIISLSEKFEGADTSLTDLTTKLLFHMAMHLKLERQEVDTRHTISSSDSQPPSKIPAPSSSYGNNIRCDDPLCVVLVPSTIIAKALNSVINKLSKTMPEYSFLRSACIHGDKAKQGIAEQSFTDEMVDNVMECVQDGSVNVLIATFEIERELYARRCSLLIRLGMPRVYENYFRVKSKLRSAGAKLVILVKEDNMADLEENHKVKYGVL